MSEKLFKITEFAKIAGMNRKTLQYYDEIGLFSPAYVAENGYRYYSLFQLDWLALIAVLRDLGGMWLNRETGISAGSAKQKDRSLYGTAPAQKGHAYRCTGREQSILPVWGKGVSDSYMGGSAVLAADPGEARTAFCSQLSDRRPQNRAFCGKK